MKHKHKKYLIYLTGFFLLYIAAVIGYSTWSNRETRKLIYAGIDDRLLVAATGIKYMLAPDFHDRATGPLSISFHEELKNRKAVSDYSRETSLAYLYTLVGKNGEFFFSAPTVTEDEARRQKSWYFHPYTDIPPEFVKAFKEKKTIYANYTDQWGKFRSVAHPEYSPGGRLYLACADYEISHIDSLLLENTKKSVLTSIFFLILTVPFIVIAWKFFSVYNMELKSINLELSSHRSKLEGLVKKRTYDLSMTNDMLKKELLQREEIEKVLRNEKIKLEKALSDVKTLSGMLPICSSCKKVRDDRGYWNQIEQYIQDHSSAEFSHSICPSCAEKLYPEVMKKKKF